MVVPTNTNARAKKYEEVCGLILSEAGGSNQYERHGVFVASSAACKVFKRPTHPIQQDENMEEDFAMLDHVQAGPEREGDNTELIAEAAESLCRFGNLEMGAVQIDKTQEDDSSF